MVKTRTQLYEYDEAYVNRFGHDVRRPLFHERTLLLAESQPSFRKSKECRLAMNASAHTSKKHKHIICHGLCADG